MADINVEIQSGYNIEVEVESSKNITVEIEKKTTDISVEIERTLRTGSNVTEEEKNLWNNALQPDDIINGGTFS